jgi:hypothetical protein
VELQRTLVRIYNRFSSNTRPARSTFTHYCSSSFYSSS